MNLNKFCDMFFSSTDIPICIFENNRILKKIGIPNFFTLPNFSTNEMNKDVFISADDNGIYYGGWKIQKQNIIIGPIKSTTFNIKTLSLLTDDLIKFYESLSPYPYKKFINLLTFMVFITTGESIETTDILAFNIYNKGIDVEKSSINDLFKKREYYNITLSHGYEQMILNYIENGEPDKLKFMLDNEIFFYDTSNSSNISHNLLRQQKNTFISLVNMVGKTAGIKGGIPIEEVYSLIYAYTLECENMLSVDHVKSLQYTMLLDFAYRVKQNKIPSHLSKEIVSCIQYINQHLNEQISIDELAAHIHRSRSYTTTHFKNETKYSINNYIKMMRMKEAAELLKYSNKTINEIALSLGYCHQSFFNNQFKKYYGMTPLCYRKNIQS